MTTAEPAHDSHAGNRVRSVAKIVTGRATQDGAGVRLTRIIGTAGLPDLDPFLMLDEFRSDTPSDYIAGFPEHPHRGFETVTYMLAGRMRHADNKGNTGLLRPGGVQWMTAGRGIVHSEMPEQEQGLLWGFQLWLNLPASQKMTEPRYQDIEPEAIPTVTTTGGGTVRVIAGSFEGRQGPVDPGLTEPIYLDVQLPPHAVFETDVPDGHAAFAYVYDGAASFGEQAAERPVKRGELAVLGPGERIQVRSEASPARFLLVAGRPLREPVAKYGPFVMNTPAEIHQAVEDFQAGRF